MTIGTIQTVAVRDVVQAAIVGVSAREPDTRIRYIDVSAISSDDLSIRSTVDHTVETAPSRARKLVRANDTIFATIRPGLRRVAQVPTALDGAVASTAFCVLRPRIDRVDPDFLFFAVTAEAFVQSVAELETGASYPAVRDADVLSQQIPLPPMSAQKQIATVLHFIRGLLLLEKDLVATSAALKTGLLRELFTRGLRWEVQKESEIGPIPQSWETVLLGDQTTTISKGASPRWQGFDYVPEGVLFVRSKNVGAGRLEWEEKAFLPPAWNEKEKRSMLRAGDVLVNLVGASIGRVATGGTEIDDANCNQAVGFVRLIPGTILPRVLTAFLLTAEGQRQIHSSKKDIARANLSLEDVRNLKVPRPTQEEQHEIAALLEAIDQSEDSHWHKIAGLENLFKVLLRDLMTGDLPISTLDLAALSNSHAAEVSG
jgi:type I restriction enzyme S subunit